MRQVRFSSDYMDLDAGPANDDILTFLDMIRSDRIVSYAQPIIDLYSGEIKGFELLARGEGCFFSPDVMFSKAREYNLEWELEYACRKAALKKISALNQMFSGCDYFINVSPDIFSCAEFQAGFTSSTLKRYGIDPRRIVFEITEKTSVRDYRHYENMIKHYVRQGVRIALDDFGSGYSGLTTLVATTPHIIKIDRSIVSDIDRNGYKQNLVRSICDFAATVGSFILFEGVGTEEELKVAYRFGVRYAQGFFFARPAPYPADLDVNQKSFLRRLVRQYSKKVSPIEITIFKFIARPPIFMENSLLCSDLDEIFRSHQETEHVVILDDANYPTGLITRQHFYSSLSGRFGYAVFQNRHADSVAKKNMLVVREDTDLRELGKFTLNRPKDDIYDPVLVLDLNNRFLGTITMRTIISRAFDTEVKFATSANPLTGLPGNVVINLWLEEVLSRSEYAIVYVDLDRFKDFNDNYGFAAGDEMLKLVASILMETIGADYPDLKLGHIGGDDFIVISESMIDPVFYQKVISRFDEEKKRFFLEADLKNGTYARVNRKGEKEDVPLVTMSIAIISSDNFNCPVHSGKLSQCISLLKGRIKAVNHAAGKSGFMQERRVYDRF